MGFKQRFFGKTVEIDQRTPHMVVRMNQSCKRVDAAGFFQHIRVDIQMKRRRIAVHGRGFCDGCGFERGEKVSSPRAKPGSGSLE